MSINDIESARLDLFVYREERIEGQLGKHPGIIEPLVTVQCTDGCHVCRGQFKIEQGCILQ